MTHLGTAPQRRRFRALDALDRLVARECEAVAGRPPARAAASAETLPDADAAADDAFIQGAIAYLSTRPNAAELVAGIERGWQELQAARDEPPRHDGDAPQAAADSGAESPPADPATGGAAESAP